jgi:membrane associated rhomboid family serine protease
MKSLFQDIRSFFLKGDSAVRKLIIINVAVFLFTSIFGKLPIPVLNEFISSLYLPAAFNEFIYKPWSLFTYIFLHAGVMHLLFNMLFLYFIGIILQDLLGNKHIFRIFLLGGMIGGALFLIFFNLIPGFKDQPLLPMVGASGGVTAIIVAAAVFTPNYKVYLFGIFSISLKWIALIRVFIDLVGLGDGNNDGGQLAHLGGAFFGYLYIKIIRGEINMPNLGLNRSYKYRTAKKRNPKLKVEVNDSKIYNEKAGRSSSYKPNQDEIDAILDKISRSGYQSLSQQEKDILFRASQD